MIDIPDYHETLRQNTEVVGNVPIVLRSTHDIKGNLLPQMAERVASNNMDRDFDNFIDGIDVGFHQFRARDTFVRTEFLESWLPDWFTDYCGI